MPISPQKFREIVFQLLYSDDFGGSSEVAEMLMAQLAVTKRIVREACAVKDKIVEKKDEIDVLIRSIPNLMNLSGFPASNAM